MLFRRSRDQGSRRPSPWVPLAALLAAVAAAHGAIAALPPLLQQRNLAAEHALHAHARDAAAAAAPGHARAHSFGHLPPRVVVRPPRALSDPAADDDDDGDGQYDDDGDDDDDGDELARRDASTLMSGGSNAEGELHTPLTVPAGARLTSLPVLGSDKNQVVVYWSKRSNNHLAEQAFVMIHGRIRNGNDYWQTMETALVNAVKANFPGASNNSIVTAPQFFSTKYNSGQYNGTQLGWGDVNAWQAGEIATHPAGTQASAFDVLDAFVQEFSNKAKYPNLKNITLVGHGGGGQLMQRYSVVGNDAPAGVHVRYIYGDPSSCVYFTKHRPEVDASIASKKTCPMFNTWRYGFDNFTDVKPTGALTPLQYFARYTQRDVVSMIGFQDVDASGDQYCMAKLQGGNKRRDRNLAYWKYINTLARTNFDLTGFNASFHTLPDWSNVTGHQIAHRLVVIEQADHDANKVFGSDDGRAALFSDSQLPTGWRPQGWNSKGTQKYTVTAPAPAPGTQAQAQAQAQTQSAAPAAGSTSASASASTASSSTSSSIQAFSTPAAAGSDEAASEDRDESAEEDAGAGSSGSGTGDTPKQAQKGSQSSTNTSHSQASSAAHVHQAVSARASALALVVVLAAGLL